MTRQDFENVLKIGEHVGVEFKRGGNGAQNDTFETICAFLNRFGRADELGSGVRNLFHYTKQYSGRTPEMDEGDIFKVTVPLVSEGAQESLDGTNDPANPRPSGAGTSSGLKSSLNQTGKSVIEAIGNDSGVTIPQLQEYLGMSRNGVKKAQERLKTSGVIRCVGSDKGGYWEIIGVD